MWDHGTTGIGLAWKAIILATCFHLSLFPFSPSLFQNTFYVSETDTVEYYQFSHIQQFIITTIKTMSLQCIYYGFKKTQEKLQGNVCVSLSQIYSVCLIRRSQLFATIFYHLPIGQHSPQNENQRRISTSLNWSVIYSDIIWLLSKTISLDFLWLWLKTVPLSLTRMTFTLRFPVSTFLTTQVTHYNLP